LRSFLFLLFLVLITVAGCGDSGSVSGFSFVNGSSGPSGGSSPNPSPSPSGSPSARLLEPHQVTVTVTLPTGMTLELTSLKVVTLAGTFPVNASGQAEVTYFNDGNQWTTVTDANGNPILFGWIGAAKTELSALSTAKVLLYFRLGGPWLTRDSQARLLEHLENQAPILGPLADAVAAALVAAPDAMSTDPAALKAALETAATAMLATPLARTITDPLEGQSGVQVIDSESGSTVRLQNYFRRRAYAYIDRTGFRPPSAQLDTPITPPVPIRDFDVSPTGGLSGVFGSLANLILGVVPYAPVLTDPTTLQVVDANGSSDSSAVVSTSYRVLVIGPGASDGLIALLTQAQRDKLGELETKAFILDFMLPIVTNIFLPVGATKVPNSPSDPSYQAFQDLMSTKLPDIINLTGQALDQGLTLVREGNLSGGVKLVVTAIATSSSASEALIDIIEIFASQLTHAQMTPAFQALGRSVTLVNAAMAGLDAGAVGKDYFKSKRVERFTVRALQSKVSLSPEAADVAPNGTLMLKATVQDPPEAVVYRWSVTGGGSLRSLNGTGNPISGTSFETPSDFATYVAPGSDVDSRVTVEAIKVTPAPRESIATANANLRVRRSQIQINPRRVSLTQGQTRNFGVYFPPSMNINTSICTFVWNTSGNFGSFAGGQRSLRTFGSPGATVPYLCTGDSPGNDTVSVTVYQPNQEGTDIELVGSSQAEARCNEPRKSILFGTPFGESRYSSANGFYELAAGAGWLIPLGSPPEDVVSYQVLIYNYAEGPLSRTFTPTSEQITVTRSTSDPPPQSGGSSLFVPDGESDVRVGAQAIKFGWTGYVGFGPGEVPPPAPNTLMGRVQPATVEVTVIYRN